MANTMNINSITKIKTMWTHYLDCMTTQSSSLDLSGVKLSMDNHSMPGSNKFYSPSKYLNKLNNYGSSSVNLTSVEKYVIPMDTGSSVSMDVDLDVKCLAASCSIDSGIDREVFADGKLVSPLCNRVSQQFSNFGNNSTLPPHIQDIRSSVLRSGVAIYLSRCDTRESSAVVVIICKHKAWTNERITAQDLTQIILLYNSLTNTREGLTLIVDARGSTMEVISILLESLAAVNAGDSSVLGLTHVLADRSAQNIFWKSPHYKNEIKIGLLTNVEALFKLIDRPMLPPLLCGTRLHDHILWVFQQELRILHKDIQECTKFCLNTLELLLSNKSHSNQLSEVLGQQIQNQICPRTRKEAEDLSASHESFLSEILNQPLLSSGLRNGRNILNRLKQSYSLLRLDQLEEDRLLLEESDELLTFLEVKVNETRRVFEMKQLKLNNIVKLRTVEEQCNQVLSGIDLQLKNIQLYFSSMKIDTFQSLMIKQKQFQQLCGDCMDLIASGNDLLPELDTMMVMEGFRNVTGISEVSKDLSSKISMLNAKLEQVQSTLDQYKQCYQLLKDANDWATEILKILISITVSNPQSTLISEDIERLICDVTLCMRRSPPISFQYFNSACTWCNQIGDTRLATLLSQVQVKCKEASNLLQRKQEKLMAIRRAMQRRQHNQHNGDNVPSSSSSSSSIYRREAESGEIGGGANVNRQLRMIQRSTWSASDFNQQLMSLRRRSYAGRSSTPMYSSAVAAFKHRNLDLDLMEYEEMLFSEGLITEDMSDRIVASLPKALQDSTMRGSRESLRSSRESLRGSQDNLTLSRGAGLNGAMSCESINLDQSQHSSGVEGGSKSHRVASKLLHPFRLWSTRAGSSRSVVNTSAEASSGEVTDGVRLRVKDLPSNGYLSRGNESGIDNGNGRIILQHILSELIDTERDYVNSLRLTVHVYLASMSRDDVPQPMRGKRNVVFGNLEKIFEFHSTQFLQDVERLRADPMSVGQVFLRHSNSFFLYSVYSKNKPKSDALMAECGNEYFKKKQHELNDRLDLSSYLLKPVQRIGKYALLLGQIIKQCQLSSLDEHETKQLEIIKEALEMIKFQLRHGNDLLAMDCIKNCDTNLKEQGMLLRQEDFTIWRGHSKSRRRIFLFEDMIVLTKARPKTSNNTECFDYKASLKMSDIGLTQSLENKAENGGTKFEIWFRKRAQGASINLYTLQADRPDIKQAWVSDISSLLWRQAICSRESSLSEVRNMGLAGGPRPPQKNEENIREGIIAERNSMDVLDETDSLPKVRNSIAVSSFDRYGYQRCGLEDCVSVTSQSYQPMNSLHLTNRFSIADDLDSLIADVRNDRDVISLSDSYNSLNIAILLSNASHQPFQRQASDNVVMETDDMLNSLSNNSRTALCESIATNV